MLQKADGRDAKQKKGIAMGFDYFYEDQSQQFAFYRIPSNADEYKDYLDMSEDMLRRSRILVVCGAAVNETVLTDIAIANRFHVASSTMRGVLGVDKSRKEE